MLKPWITHLFLLSWKIYMRFKLTFGAAFWAFSFIPLGHILKFLYTVTNLLCGEERGREVSHSICMTPRAEKYVPDVKK